ncbi:MAG: gfo/Idh/MocA family oxidoreductase [Gemmatimonadetes bacterium]|nr:MAG: gfo/Idh/MocA family oxidoreductase [Gemmatimonadota bacterium]PYO82904.1 MAG: gfo/Idh/MocA family oxidoreductase [Gemmatimonadota bacterium]PYP61294.1 MAG: gfo/Idh/MocA family oxidoreductase [Gemmatimonadota bacterium]
MARKGKRSIGRRQFLANTAAGGAALWAMSPMARVLGANDRLRLGLIGGGARGQDLLSQALKLPNVELVAVADVYTRRHDEVRRVAPAARAFSDHRRLLDLKDVDAVLVASPLHCHARHFLDTIAAGKDLYSEKTMTWSIPEAEACLAAAKRSDRVIQIGLQHVSTGAFADARKWVADGVVGKVTSVQSWMSRNTPRGHGQWVRSVPSDCTADNVQWDLFLNGRPARPFDAFRFINWRLFWEFSGGNITENMVHQLSWIMGVLDLPVPVAAYMSGGVFSEKDGREVPDTIAVTLDFPTDLVVTWQSTFSNSRYGLGERILGSHGTVERVSGSTDMVTGRLTSGVRYDPEKANRPDGAAVLGQSPDQDHMANFVDCVRSRKTPNAPVEVGYRTAVAAHMANLAYRQKARVTAEMAMATGDR